MTGKEMNEWLKKTFGDKDFYVEILWSEGVNRKTRAQSIGNVNNLGHRGWQKPWDVPRYLDSRDIPQWCIRPLRIPGMRFSCNKVLKEKKQCSRQILSSLWKYYFYYFTPAKFSSAPLKIGSCGGMKDGGSADMVYQPCTEGFQQMLSQHNS